MQIRFTRRAETDIIESYLYGLEYFGREQADAYEESLHRAMEMIAANPRMAAERHEFAPPVRVHHHARHYIIYVIEEASILVVRVLRDEMDLSRHLNVG